jgi:pSer/pThr/pTyr-binding forkhead associated (FHA) protein
MDDMPPIDPHETCGPKLATPPDGDLPPSFAPLRLMLQPGGLCVTLTRTESIVGRHSGADIRLSLPDISRRHCRFVFTEGSWQVFDLNSLNGVFVNGERLHEAPVRHGDRIRIGSLTFEVDLGDGMTQPGDQGSMRKAS